VIDLSEREAAERFVASPADDRVIEGTAEEVAEPADDAEPIDHK
jgi:hypothetical protein